MMGSLKAQAPSWQAVGPNDFNQASYNGANYPSLVFNGTVPYVVYSDGGNSYKATVKKFNGTSWELVGTAGFSVSTASYPSLAFNGTVPYVVYQDGGNSYKATVQKFNGTSWELVGTAGFSAGSATYTGLAFNGTVPYVVYRDAGNSSKATVQKFNGASWETVGTDGFSAGSAYNPSLAFNGTVPYVVYGDAGNSDKATVQKFNGTSWELVGTAGFSAGSTMYTSIISTGSELIVAYSSGGAFAKSFSLTTLPVSLTSFEASIKNQKQVNLTWQTASETNNDYFTISKSQDGKIFDKLLNINSKGDNGAAYSTIDFSPFAGTSYYKLSQTDVDGNTEELGVRTVKLADLNEEGLLVYPNPVVNGVINIQHQNLSGLQQIIIYKIDGEVILKDKVLFNNGLAIYQLEKNIPKGLYLISIGNKKHSTKISIE